MIVPNKRADEIINSITKNEKTKCKNNSKVLNKDRILLMSKYTICVYIFILVISIFALILGQRIDSSYFSNVVISVFGGVIASDILAALIEIVVNMRSNKEDIKNYNFELIEIYRSISALSGYELLSLIILFSSCDNSKFKNQNPDICEMIEEHKISEVNIEDYKSVVDGSPYSEFYCLSNTNDFVQKLIIIDRCIDCFVTNNRNYISEEFINKLNLIKYQANQYENRLKLYSNKIAIPTASNFDETIIWSRTVVNASFIKNNYMI